MNSATPPCHLRVVLTAFDSLTLSGSLITDYLPLLVNVTADSVPPGALLYLNGVGTVTPAVLSSVVGNPITVSATSLVVVGGTSYSFSSWSDGGAASHILNGTAITANYVRNCARGARAFAHGPDSF